jgi:opacity protein-like surface antigen
LQVLRPSEQQWKPRLHQAGQPVLHKPFSHDYLKCKHTINNHLKVFFMKKILFGIIAILVVNNAFSQAKFGVKAGINFSALSDVEYFTERGYLFTPLEKDGMATGYHVGIFSNVRLGKTLSFQPELLFSMQGGKQQAYEGLNGGSGWVAGPELRYQLGYVQIPLLFEIKPVANIGIIAGAQLSFNVSQKCIYTYDRYVEILTGSNLNNSIYGDGIKKNDAGLVFGLQYTFIKKVTVGVRDNLGLIRNWDFTTSYDKNQTSKGWKSNVIQVGLGYSF